MLRGAQTRYCALRGSSKVCVAIQQALGGLRVAVINGQVDVGIELLGHSLQQIVHAKGRRNPAHNAPLAALNRAEVGILAIKRQVHDQPGHGITPHVLLQPEPGGQGQFAGVARAVQRLAGGGNSGNIEPQRLEVVAGLGLDVGDRGVVRLRDLRVHVVRQEAFVAHLLHMGVQLVCRQIQHIGHALQPGPGFRQAQRLHIGLKLVAINAVGAVVVALHAAQHQFVGGHAVFEARNNALDRDGKGLVPFGVSFALCALPVQKRQSQQEHRQHRPRQRKQTPTVFSRVRPLLVLAGLAHGVESLDGCLVGKFVCSNGQRKNADTVFCHYGQVPRPSPPVFVRIRRPTQAARGDAGLTIQITGAFETVPMPSLDFEREEARFYAFHDQNLQRLQEACASFATLITALLSASGQVDVAKVGGRVKDKTECIQKFTRKYRPSLEEANLPYEIAPYITDLIGVRVVCLYEDELEKVAHLVRSHFDVMEVTDKVAAVEGTEASFGYKGLHLDLRLNAARRALPEHAACAGHAFELQVRTIIQDSWSVLDHKIKYKKSIPGQLKRRINVLSALFELADREFRQIRD
ncbi:MAG: hypothetical protein ACD_23C00335G0001, partial [uncultured bacterium]